MSYKGTSIKITVDSGQVSYKWNSIDWNNMSGEKNTDL